MQTIHRSWHVKFSHIKKRPIIINVNEKHYQKSRPFTRFYMTRGGNHFSMFIKNFLLLKTRSDFFFIINELKQSYRTEKDLSDELLLNKTKY